VSGARERERGREREGLDYSSTDVRILSRLHGEIILGHCLGLLSRVSAPFCARPSHHSAHLHSNMIFTSFFPHQDPNAPSWYHLVSTCPSHHSPNPTPTSFCLMRSLSNLRGQLDGKEKKKIILLLKDDLQSLVPGPSPQRRPYTIAHQLRSTFNDDLVQAGKGEGSTRSVISEYRCVSSRVSRNGCSKVSQNPQASNELAESVVAVLNEANQKR
jgi:hypothetical protein